MLLRRTGLQKAIEIQLEKRRHFLLSCRRVTGKVDAKKIGKSICNEERATHCCEPLQKGSDDRAGAKRQAW